MQPKLDKEREEAMKKLSNVFVFVSLISALLILLAFGFFMRNTNHFFSDYYNQQLNDYSSVFRKAIEMAEDYTEIYERAVADDLYHRLFELSRKLEDVPSTNSAPKGLKRYGKRMICLA